MMRKRTKQEVEEALIKIAVAYNTDVESIRKNMPWRILELENESIFVNEYDNPPKIQVDYVSDSQLMHILGNNALQAIHDCALDCNLIERRRFIYVTPLKDKMRLLLFCGIYGDFPRTEIPVNNNMDYIRKSKRILNRTGLLSAKREVLKDTPDFFFKPLINHRSLYAVVQLLTCIRHEIMVEDYKKRNFQWEPLVKFESLLSYSKSNYQEQWLAQNNIILAEIVEFVEDLFLFLLSSYKYRRQGEASFLINSLSEGEIAKLPCVSAIKWPLVKPVAYKAITEMLKCVDKYMTLLLNIKVKPIVSFLNKPSIEQCLKELFIKIRKLELYVSQM